MADADARDAADGGGDRRLNDLFVDSIQEADLVLAGVPYDATVLGRRGCKDGPAAIREAFRFIANHDPDDNRSIETARIFDAGDIDGLPEGDVRAAHDQVSASLAPLLRDRRGVLLGGDHGLTFAHIKALAGCTEGRIGIVVIDAHYDLRAHEDQPTSGTPFRRILDHFPDRVAGHNIVEIGIRPWANTRTLADEALRRGVHIVTPSQVRAAGSRAIAREALVHAGQGVDHLWLSVDIDGLDQSIAAGCSAPGAGGLAFHEADAIVRAVAADARCRGMDILEVAPGLDPTGNTQRTAAQLVASFIAASMRGG